MIDPAKQGVKVFKCYFHTFSFYPGICPDSEPTTVTPTTTLPPPEPLPGDIRLNKTLIPTHYNVELQPYIYEEDDPEFAFKIIGQSTVFFRLVIFLYSIFIIPN